MNFAAALALLLASGHVAVLRDDVNEVLPSHWRYDQFLIREQVPANVDCVFHVLRGPGVRVELVTAEDLDRLRRGEPHNFITASSDSQRGELHQALSVPGRFAVVVFNGDKTRIAEVALRLSLDLSQKSTDLSRFLSPQRKLSVIFISFFGFLAIAVLSARKLLIAMREPPSVSGGGEGGDLGEGLP